MKTDRYTDIICRGFCSFYRGGREELTCGSYRFLVGNLTLTELKVLASGAGKQPDLSADEEICSLVCNLCDFLTDGCDFRAGLDSPPCGGYTIVEALLKGAS